MISEQFSLAWNIVNQAGNRPTILNEEEKLPVLNGITRVCGSLSLVLSHSLKQEGWDRIPDQTQLSLISAYDELWFASEAVRTEAGLPPPEPPNLRLDGDARTMAVRADSARQVSFEIVSTYRQGESVRPGRVALLGLATAGAVVAWEPEQNAFRGYHETRLESGLEGLRWIDRYLWNDAGFDA